MLEQDAAVEAPEAGAASRRRSRTRAAEPAEAGAAAATQPERRAGRGHRARGACARTPRPRRPRPTPRRPSAERLQRCRWRPGGRGRRRAGVKRRAKRPKSTVSSAVELVLIILVARRPGASPSRRGSSSPIAFPAARWSRRSAIGQRVLVNRIGMHFGKPHVGEIAVFHPPQGASRRNAARARASRPAARRALQPVPKEDSVNFIKRDRRRARRHDQGRRRTRDPQRQARGRLLHPPVPGRRRSATSRWPIKVPAGHWFMMGDNRGESDDSRFWGPVPTGWIIGGAFATYWPPDRIGIL